MKRKIWAVAAASLMVIAPAAGCQTRRAPVSPTLAAAPPAASASPDQRTQTEKTPGEPRGQAREKPVDSGPAKIVALARPQIPADLPEGESGELIRLGRTIADETPRMLGEAAQKTGHPYSGNSLSCSSCHRQAGMVEGVLSWFGITDGYPRYQAREGRTVSLAEQVNACLQRNLLAEPLPVESREMRAVAAWLGFLGEYPPTPAPPYLQVPNRRADLTAGEAVYRRACQNCHGADGGLGGPGASPPVAGEIPPLWGPHSYGTGSGLHRVLTAAAFLREQMPPGATPQQPMLGQDEAFDLAAYVNSFARPESAGLDRDYPALSEKPADCAYPPFADRFPADQHKYGPYLPILIEAEAARAGDWRRFRDSLVKYHLSGPVMAETTRNQQGRATGR